MSNYTQEQVDKMIADRLLRENEKHQKELDKLKTSNESLTQQNLELEKKYGGLQDEVSTEKFNSFIKETKLNLSEEKVNELKELSNGNIDQAKKILSLGEGIVPEGTKEADIFNASNKPEPTPEKPGKTATDKQQELINSTKNL